MYFLVGYPDHREARADWRRLKQEARERVPALEAVASFAADPGDPLTLADVWPELPEGLLALACYQGRPLGDVDAHVFLPEGLVWVRERPRSPSPPVAPSPRAADDERYWFRLEQHPDAAKRRISEARPLAALAFAPDPQDETAIRLALAAAGPAARSYLVCYRGRTAPGGCVPTEVVWVRPMHEFVGGAHESAAASLPIDIANLRPEAAVPRQGRVSDASGHGTSTSFAPRRKSVAARRKSSTRTWTLAAAIIAALAVFAVARAQVMSQHPSVATASLPSPTTRSGTPNGAAATKAQVDASAAAIAARNAQSAAGEAQTALSAATQQSQSIRKLSAAGLARDPQALDPQSDLSTLVQTQSQISAQAQSAQADAASASQSATVATSVDPGSQAAANARASATDAANALASAQGAKSQVDTLVSQAQAAVASWEKIHAQPPGVLGVRVIDPPSDWTVRGCEVTTAEPGSAASTIGLIGSTQRTDPVGDIIASITDAADGNAKWSIGSCADLQSAMANTRAGDQLTVTYYHRNVTWYDLSGTWVAESGTATLAPANGPTCPQALTGTITPAITGSRIDLTVDLVGPALTQNGLIVMLDTGGVQTYFADNLLRKLGFTPYMQTQTGGIVPGATGPAYMYHIPGSALQVNDHGTSVALATGTLTVMGIVGGNLYGLGPDILKHGAKLSTSGNEWTLVPPCP